MLFLVSSCRLSDTFVPRILLLFPFLFLLLLDSLNYLSFLPFSHFFTPILEVNIQIFLFKPKILPSIDQSHPIANCILMQIPLLEDLQRMSHLAQPDRPSLPCLIFPDILARHPSNQVPTPASTDHLNIASQSLDKFRISD